MLTSDTCFLSTERRLCFYACLVTFLLHENILAVKCFRTLAMNFVANHNVIMISFGFKLLICELCIVFHISAFHSQILETLMSMKKDIVKVCEYKYMCFESKLCCLMPHTISGTEVIWCLFVCFTNVQSSVFVTQLWKYLTAAWSVVDCFPSVSQWLF